MRRAMPLLIIVCVAGCSSAAPSASGGSSSATTTSSPTSAPPQTSSAAADVGYNLDLAVEICTTGLISPDTLILDAATAARAGTRTVAEVAEAFREAQDEVEAQADRAETGGLPNLAQALQAYADTLGQARVSGSAGLDEITSSRQAVDTACFVPAAPTS